MRFRWGFVLPLAIMQVVSWGSLYYSFAVISEPMAAELGWSKPAVQGALSAGLAATGAASLAAGRIVDAGGGRALMTAGSAAAAILLVLWSLVSALWQLYAVWVALGAVLAMVLYEPVFAVLARELGEDYRRAIVVVTLFGGLASTVFLPLTSFLESSLGWRQALMVMAILHVPVGAMVHWLVLPAKHQAGQGRARVTAPGRVLRAMGEPVFWLLALSYGAHAFMFTGLTFHIIPMLMERGFTVAAIVGAYAVVGPCQVMGRLVVYGLERWISVSLAGVAATLLPAIGVGLLLAATPGSLLIYLFAIAYGSGVGIKTIVQATAAPEFLGREGYGALQGTLAGVNFVIQAATPFLVALLWSQSGRYDTVPWVLFAAAVLSGLAFIAALAVRRPVTGSGSPHQ